jgi:adenosine deaminase
MSPRMTDGDVCNLPKTDLHRHVDGAAKPELILKLARELGIKLPTYDLTEFTKLYQITQPKGMSIPEIFQRFAWTIAVMRAPHGLYEVFREQVHNLAKENILYAELRFAPGYHSIYPPFWYKPELYEEKPFPAMSLNETVEYALDGLEQGMKETGVTVNLILCIDRESLFSPNGHGQKSVRDIVDLGLKFQGEGVVGLDLACNEALYPPDPYFQYFLPLQTTNLGSTFHVDEMGTNRQRRKNLAACAQLPPKLKKRFGHAIHLFENKELMRLARENNIGIERVPCTPIKGCSLKDGHLYVLLKNKVPVAIVSDDPVLMQKSLTDNWLAVRDYHDFGDEAAWQLTANALNTAFYRNETQKKMVQDIFVKRGLSRSLLRK